MFNRHLSEVSFKDPYTDKEWTLNGRDILVRGTAGAGDFMFCLSTVYYVANLLNTQLNIIFHWSHDKDFNYHFEDPESIFEKIDFVHSISYNSHKVTIEHVYNCDIETMFGLQLILNLTRRDSSKKGLNVPKGLCSWKFKPHIMRTVPVKNEVTVWRPKFNAEIPPLWKRTYSDIDWELAIQTLKDSGYIVHDLCYRTPIRDVLYHMQRARFVMGYDGMWHYFARMLYKPTACVGDSSIVNVHDPQAYPLMSPKKDKSRSFTMQSLVENLDKSLIKLDSNVKKYIKNVDYIIENR